jgi:hypothetical protein
MLITKRSPQNVHFPLARHVHPANVRATDIPFRLVACASRHMIAASSIGEELEGLVWWELHQCTDHQDEKGTTT